MQRSSGSAEQPADDVEVRLVVREVNSQTCRCKHAKANQTKL